jgi:hypothetical protein
VVQSTCLHVSFPYPYTFPHSPSLTLVPQAAQDVLTQHWAAADGSRLRQLGAADLLAAAQHVRPSVSKSAAYSAGLHGSASFDGSGGGGSSGGAGLSGALQIMAAAAAAAAAQRRGSGGGSEDESPGHGPGARSSGGGGFGSREGPGSSGLQQPSTQPDDELCRLVGRLVLGSLGGAMGATPGAAP